MYQVLTNIQIQQIPTDEHPDRNWLIVFSFLHSYEGYSSWEDLTQTLKLTLPKKVAVKAYRITGQPFGQLPIVKSSYILLGNRVGENSNIGGFDKAPAMLRGDIIKVNVGYRAFVNGTETTYWTGQDGVPDMFKGFISGVQPKLPFTIECEDNMWLCKQIPTPAKNWGNVSLQHIVGEVIKAGNDQPIVQRYKGYVDLKVSDFSKTDLKFNVNSFTTTRGSLAMLLARLKGQYRIDSYFRGDELRIGYTHYIVEESVRHTFTFQKNIISDTLKWERRDDHILSMIVRSNYRVEETGTTLEGDPKSKQASTEILIYFNAGAFTYIKKEKGKEYPSNALNDIGERFTMQIDSPIADPKKLFEIGKTQLEKYYYDGFRGSFTTFGIPAVKHGDMVELVNYELPEQNGVYMVKAVKPYGLGDSDGLRQEITVDYKIS